MAIADARLKEIAEIILDAVGLEHISLDELSDDSQLGQTPLEMDSIDILEAVAAIENKYGVKVADAKEGAQHFQSLKSIAAFIDQNN